MIFHPFSACLSCRCQADRRQWRSPPLCGVTRWLRPSLVCLGLLCLGLLCLGLVCLGLVSISPPQVLSANATELREIRQRGRLTIGIKGNLPPLGFQTEPGEFAGLEIDLARQIAQTLLGDPDAVTFKPLSNRDRLPALLNHEVDLVIAQLTVTAGRSRLIDFSIPYYLDGTGIISRNSALENLTDLRGQSIGVLQGSSTIAILRSRLPQAELVGVESYRQAQQWLDTGRISAFAADATVLTGWLRVNPDYHLLPSLFSTQALAVGMPKGLQYEDLRQQVNRAIEAWQRSGTLRQRIVFWQLPEQGAPD